MSSLNISSLHEKINENNLKSYKIYDNVLKKLHRKIKYHADLKKTYCFFKIPGFIIGVPLYNIDKLKDYILISLDKDCFQYIYIEPNWIFISWEIKNKNNLLTLNLCHYLVNLKIFSLLLNNFFLLQISCQFLCSYYTIGITT